MKTIKRNLLLFLFIIVCKGLIAQDYCTQAKKYFSAYTDSKAVIDLCVKSLPTLDDCKSVLIGTDAYTYFGMITEMANKAKEETNTDSVKTYVDVKVESFTTYDIKDGKGNYVGGMKNILSKLQPNVTFYKVSYLKNKGDESGVAYKYWVYIYDHWVFLPKIYAAFSGN